MVLFRLYFVMMLIIILFFCCPGQCKECKNFNSMFAILSGLGHGSVSRLKQTWERLTSKYQRMYQDMQDLMDPSRNMSKYRNLVQNENIQSPIVSNVTNTDLILNIRNNLSVELFIKSDVKSKIVIHGYN